MDSRLAHIIASSIGPDGKPDRAKIYEALSLTPEAPETFLIEAVLAVEDRNAQAIRRLETIANTATTAIAREREHLEAALASHQTLLERDAQSRGRWLAIAIAIPCLVTAIAFTAVYYLVNRV